MPLISRVDPSLRPPRPNIVAVGVLFLFVLIGVGLLVATGSFVPLIVSVVVGIIAARSPRIAQQWERAVVLRLGRFHALKGPGLFWVVPFIDEVTSWIDQRTTTTSFAAEQTLTRRYSIATIRQLFTCER